MFATLFSQIGVPVVMGVVAEALRKINTPLASDAADALGRLNAAIKSGDVTPEQIAEANRHAERMAEIELQRHQSDIAETNETIRAEIARMVFPSAGFDWRSFSRGVAG